MPLAIIACLGAVAVSGCLNGGDSGPESPSTIGAVAPHRLDAPGFYSFEHGGGPLEIGLEAGPVLDLVLYGADDARIGRLSVSPDGFNDAVTLKGLDAGQYVLDIVHINGTLHVESAGNSVAWFTPLPVHIERFEIADHGFREGLLDPLVILPAFEPTGIDVSDVVSFNTTRAPLRVDLLASGEAFPLDASVTRGGMPVMQFLDSYSTRFSNGYGLEVLASADVPIGAPILDWTVTYAAEQFQGALILQTTTFSRYVAPLRAPAATVTVDQVEFTYGEVPGEPVGITVHPGADSLYLWTTAQRPDEPDPDGRSSDGEDVESDHERPSCADAVSDYEHGNDTFDPLDCEFEPVAFAAVYDPDDVRLGVYGVSEAGALDIPIGAGGEYVIVPLSAGSILVGADRVPQDFEMRVLETAQIIVPEGPAGAPNDYQIATVPVDPLGPVIGAVPIVQPGAYDRDPALPGSLTEEVERILFGDTCSWAGSVQLIVDGASVGAWGSGAPGRVGMSGAIFELDGDDITVVHDGMGGYCDYTAIGFVSYLR